MYAEKGEGGRFRIGAETPNSMLKTLLPISMQFSIYRGAIDCSEQQRPIGTYRELVYKSINETY
jgi:hypothetical protein